MLITRNMEQSSSSQSIRSYMINNFIGINVKELLPIWQTRLGTSLYDKTNLRKQTTLLGHK